MKLPYISILRSLSILTVVAFHTYMYTYTGHFPASAERYREAYEWVNECVGINIAMPMFTLMAGYLFDYFYDKGKYRKLLPLLEKKAMRLLLPCFVFGTLMMATTGMAFEPWTLLRGGCQHLWYLPMLFWCFPLAWLVKRFVDNKWERTAVLAAFFFLSTLDGVPLPHVLGLPGITAWFGWFMLGGMIASHQEVLFGVIERYRLAVPLLLPFALQAWFAPVPYSEQNTWYSVLCTALALVGIVYVFANAGGGGISEALPAARVA